MFAQFFGSYLLNTRRVTPEQLSMAIEFKKSTRLKLGTIAMNEGLLNAEQVEQIHAAQASADKRFGDLAVEMGLLKPEQLSYLLKRQPADYLVIGQALVDINALTNAGLAEAVASYKKENSLTDLDLAEEKNDKLRQMVSEFYHFETSDNAKFYTEYVTLLFRNLTRFIGDDFMPLEAEIINRFACTRSVTQRITGEGNFLTTVDADEPAYLKLAERFAGEELGGSLEYADAIVGEFLNQHNGLFIVNLSNEFGEEYTLTPQTCYGSTVCEFPEIAFYIPVQFPFGKLNFIIASDNV